ncbi:MAG: flagellar protein FlaG [Candidatus Anammoxibacter sp.]
MENIQQITKTVTLNLPVVPAGENSGNVEKTPAVYQQPDKPTVNVIEDEIERKEVDKEQNDETVKEADRIISIVNNKLQIVSDDRSRTGLVVKILNRDSGDLIKQIPSEEVLNIIARLKESAVGGIIDDSA